ncbi:unnamed protein product [Rotaria sp. Silwood2]|nr:unnamed protein product [Rotaria sp. Silwood2]
MIEAIHETIEQLRPTEQQPQASTIDIHSFTLDKSEDTAIDLLKVKLMETLNNYVRRLSGICRNYLFKFLQQYDYDENMRNFTSSFNMDTLDPFARDLEAALASIDAFAAAYKGSKDPVLEFLNKYPTLKDKPGLYGTTLLYSAARNNHEVLVRYLIESAQCAINAQNQQQLEDVLQTHVESTYKQINPSSGSTALHGACFNGHLKIVQYLMKRGADYFIRNQIQETPIMNGQRHGNIREFFEKFLILGYSTTAKTLPEKPISERPENNTFDCIWEHKSVSNPQWSQFSDDESKELSKALIISPDEEMQRTIYLGVPPNTFSVSIVEFVRSGINRDPNNQRAWVRCRGSSIFNYDCYARWQIMLLKHKGIQTASPASWNITDIPAVYDSKFQVQLNCWYNCTNKINARLDDAINYRRKQMNMELPFLKDDFDFDLQEFTFQNSDKTVSGCIRWIPKLIANDERYRNKIHEIDNYQNLSHVQPIPLTTKRLREVSKMSPTKPSTKLDDDFKEEDENDEDLTLRTFLNGNVDEDSLDETNKNKKWSLFDITQKSDEPSEPKSAKIVPEEPLAVGLQNVLNSPDTSQSISLQKNSISKESLDKLQMDLKKKEGKVSARSKEVEDIKAQLKAKDEENEKLEKELDTAKEEQKKAQQQKKTYTDQISKLEEDISQMKEKQDELRRTKQETDQKLNEELTKAELKHKEAEKDKKDQAKKIADLAKKIKDIEAAKEELRKKEEEEKQNLENKLKIVQEEQRRAEQEKQRQQVQIAELEKLTKELETHKRKGEQEKAYIEKIEKTILADAYSKIEAQIARDFLAPKQVLILDHMKKTGQTVDKYFNDRIPKMLLGEVMNGSFQSFTVTIIGFQDHHDIFKAMLARIRKFIKSIQKTKDFYKQHLEKVTEPIKNEIKKVNSRMKHWSLYVESFDQLLREKSNEYIELFNIYIEDKKKLLIDQCILGDLTTIKAELEKQTDSFIKDKPLITEIEPLKYQTLEKFIEQNITHQRNHYEKKPSPKAVSVLDTFIKQLKEDFKTNQKFTGLRAKHFGLIPGPLQRLIIYSCCFYTQLPLFESALDLLDKVNQNTVTTISTSTGSGKSTLLPALLAAECYDKIIVTQPRRLPCTLICQRVNETMTSVKDPFSEKLAGWAVSGAERNPRAKILYVTNGLLKERLLYDENFITHNTQLNKSIIFFIDEVHERSVNIDPCLALLARMLSINPALKSKMKIIISSATLDSSVPDLFRKIKQVSLTEFVMPQMGTIHPITKYSRKNENILNIVQELYQKRRRHDQILCFVSSVKDVNECCSLLKTITGGVITAYPLIQSQQASTQKEYIENGSVFFSTTVAETSLTFPQLRYVIDTGMINIPVYDPESKRTVLQEDRAAESTIKQRLGRLGRTQPGEYYSLYDFEVEEKKYPTPQICQSDLTNIEFALRKSPLKQGLHHMKQFFPDSPPNKTIDQTVKTLRLLAAPSEDFTKHGEALAKLPDFGSLAMSKCILSALQNNSCGRDLIYLSSILSVLNTSALLKSIPEHLKSSDGDFMTLFNVMRAILLVKQSVPDNQFNLQYVCQVKGLSAIHHILRQALRRYVSLERSFNSLVEYRAQSQITSGNWPSIAKSLLAGYYENVFVSLKEIYGRNHHYVRYDSTNENIAVLDSQSTLARHRSMSPVPLVLARDIRYASSIRSRAVLSFLGELQPGWIEYQVQRNIVLNEKEAAYLTNKYILPTAKTNFHSIDIQLISDTLSIEGKAGTSLKAELCIRQQLTVEQPEFELENRFDPDTEEYKNLSRNLESEAERQAKITVNPNTSTKNITVKIIARDSDYENIKKEFKSFVRWLGYCAVMRRPNSGVPPRVFRPQVRAQYHDIEERISHITDTKRTLIDLYKSVKGQNATRETRMEVVAWIAVCKFSCKVEGGFVRD